MAPLVPNLSQCSISTSTVDDTLMSLILNGMNSTGANEMARTAPGFPSLSSSVRNSAEHRRKLIDAIDDALLIVNDLDGRVGNPAVSACSTPLHGQ